MDPRDHSLENLKKYSLHSREAFWASAFVRHKGVLTTNDAIRLQQSTVAIAGLGAVGGAVFLSLVRSGVGRFRLADFDSFEASNLNRQTGCRADTLGRPKIDVLIEEALAINPYLEITPFPSGVDSGNVEAFVVGADLVIDAMDFFAYRTRLTLIKTCRDRNRFVVTSGNIGFGASLLVFDPHGVDPERFLDISDLSTEEEVMASFAIAWVPRHFNASYTDPAYVSVESKVGPSTGVASLLASALVSTETIRLLLGRSGLKPVPHYVQIDIHQEKLVKGTLRWGNRGWIQRIRRRVLLNRYWGKRLGFRPVPPPNLPQARVLKQPVPEDVVRAVLTSGLQAGSGDNIQPWYFKRDGDKIHVELNEEIDRSYFNYRNIPSLISAGAVLENMRIAASSYGLSMPISPPDHPGPRVATVQFELSDAPRDPLYEVLWERNTNRRFFQRRDIRETVVHRLRASLADFPEVGWHAVHERSAIKTLAQAVFLVDRLRSERRDLHEHLHSMLRFSPEEVYRTRDGFPLRNLKAGWHGEWFLRLTHPWWVMAVLNGLGFSRGVALFAYREILTSSMAVLLTLPDGDPTRVVRGGQAFQRVWLEATRHGLAFQPMAALPIFLNRRQQGDDGDLLPRHRDMLSRAEALEQDVFRRFNPRAEHRLILFRLGYADAIEVGTLRRPLNGFFKPVTAEPVKPRTSIGSN